MTRRCEPTEMNGILPVLSSLRKCGRGTPTMPPGCCAVNIRPDGTSVTAWPEATPPRRSITKSAYASARRTDSPSSQRPFPPRAWASAVTACAAQAISCCGGRRYPTSTASVASLIPTVISCNGQGSRVSIAAHWPGSMRNNKTDSSNGTYRGCPRPQRPSVLATSCLATVHGNG